MPNRWLRSGNARWCRLRLSIFSSSAAISSEFSPSSSGVPASSRHACARAARCAAASGPIADVLDEVLPPFGSAGGETETLAVVGAPKDVLHALAERADHRALLRSHRNARRGGRRFGGDIAHARGKPARSARRLWRASRRQAAEVVASTIPMKMELERPARATQPFLDSADGNVGYRRSQRASSAPASRPSGRPMRSTTS